MVCQKTAVLRAKAMMGRHYFMFPPYSSWLTNIIKLVQDMAAYGRTFNEIMTTVEKFSPQNGWTEETKTLAELATKIAVTDFEEKRD